MRLSILLLVMVVGVVPALAQRDKSAAAESLFDQGRALMKKRDYAAACKRFAASHEIEPSVGALLNLARCRAANGQKATAWAAYREAAGLARKLGDRRREKLASKSAERLEGELAYMRITVPDEARVDGLRITRNGVAVEDALWNLRAPLDAGDYVFEASAPGHRRWSTSVTVPARPGEIEVIIPPLEAEPAVVEQPAVATVEPSPTEQAQPAPVEPLRDEPGPGLSRGRKAALAVASGGVVSLVVGGVFALRSRSKWDEAKPYCNADNECSDAGVELASEASDAATVSNIAYAVGAVAVGGAVVLWVLSPSPRSDDRARLSWRPRVGPHDLGVDVRWRF